MSLLELTSDEYHSDPAPEPSLNSTTARVLLSKTPAHAKAQHPRLSDVPLEPRSSEAMDMGTAVHQLLLRDNRIEVENFDSYRTGEAKAWRYEVRGRGRIPMLAHQWNRACSVAAAVREQMKLLPKPTPFTAGTPEATLTWEEQGTWLRARLDWLRDDFTYIDDLKCTSKTANPRVWEKQIWNMGYDLQAALYRRAVLHTYDVQPRFRWIVVETTPPYCCSVVELSDGDMHAANVKVDAALQIWRECVEKNDWPGYPAEVHVAYAPGWAKNERDEWADVEIDESVPF